MKIINIILIILCIKSNIESAKNFKFLTINTCTNKSELIILEKCEIEDSSLTVLANVKTVNKLFVCS